MHTLSANRWPQGLCLNFGMQVMSIHAFEFESFCTNVNTFQINEN